MYHKEDVHWISIKTKDGKKHFGNAISYGFDLEPYQTSIFQREREPFVSWVSIAGKKYDLEADMVTSISVDGNELFNISKKL